MPRKKSPKKPAKKIVKRGTPRKLIKRSTNSRGLNRRGIIMTIVAFGVFGALFVMFALQKQIKENNLLGTYTYLAKDGGGDNSGSGSGSSNSGSGSSGSSQGGETEQTDNSTQQETEQHVETPEAEQHTTSAEPTHIEPTHIEATQKVELRRTDVTRGPEPTHMERKLTVIPTTKVVKALQKELRKETNEASRESLTKIKPPERPITPPTRTEGKIVFSNNRGVLETKTVSADGTETKVENTTADDALKNLDRDVKIVPNKDNSVTLNSGSVGAKTSLQITVNTDTNKLAVETNNELKDLNVLPDQAIETLKSSNLLTDIKQSETVPLTNKDGQPTFTVEGTKSKKILGLIPVSIHKSIDVSAETGKVTHESVPFFDTILSIISI